MGIDPLDEDDVPTAGSDSAAGGADSPAAVGWDSGADPDADRMAYNVRYRETVAADYQAAWTEALPAFREAWEEHKKKYPHPERSRPTVDADGSWHGDSGRELSPAQNAEMADGCVEIRREAKGDILPALRRVEAADSERYLVGLENWLKGEDRLKEKVADRLRYQPELTARQALAEVPDAVRFTLAYSESRYAEGVRADIDRMKAEGFELIKLKNSWTSDQYKGINSQWRRVESGLRFELQFHTQASFEAKELTHKAYERIRDPMTSKDEEDQLVSYQRRVNALVPSALGAADIESYPPEDRDG